MAENSFFSSGAAFCCSLLLPLPACCCWLLLLLLLLATTTHCTCLLLYCWLMLPIACFCVIPHACIYDHILESLCITNHPPCSLTQQDLFRPNLALKHEEVVPQNKGPHQLGAAKKEKKVVSSSAIPTHQGSTKDFRALELVHFHCKNHLVP